MANYKEIVTKAVVGKAKKANTLHLSLTPDENINTVLGCWVINHNFKGMNQAGKVGVDGAFDVNVWYSYENDTKSPSQSSLLKQSIAPSIILFSTTKTSLSS